MKFIYLALAILGGTLQAMTLDTATNTLKAFITDGISLLVAVDTHSAENAKYKLLYILAKNKSARDESSNVIESVRSRLYGRLFLDNYQNYATTAYLGFLIVMVQKFEEEIERLVNFYDAGNRLVVSETDKQALIRLQSFSKSCLDLVTWYPQAYKALNHCTTLQEFLEEIIKIKTDLLGRFSIKQLQQAARDINLLKKSENNIIKEIYYPIFQFEYEMLTGDIFCWIDALVLLTKIFLQEKNKNRAIIDIKLELMESIEKGTLVVSPYIDQSLLDDDMTKDTLHIVLSMVMNLNRQYEKILNLPHAAQAA